MSKKLIAIDLDGTTLNNQSDVTVETKNVIQQLTALGHKVVISTGRPFRTSASIYNKLKLTTPMINFNGAYCHTPHDSQWTKEFGYHKPIERDLALEMLDYKDEKEIQLIAAESKDRVYTSGNFIPYDQYFPNGDLDARPFNAENLVENPTSVNIFTESNYLQDKMQERILKTFGSDIEIRTWGGYAPCLEVVASGVQKAMGVEHLAHFYGIKQADVLAFGDEDNDYEMLQYAGHGVAMKNSIPALKKIADHVTSYSNHENGLARYLTEYFSL